MLELGMKLFEKVEIINKTRFFESVVQILNGVVFDSEEELKTCTKNPSVGVEIGSCPSAEIALRIEEDLGLKVDPDSGTSVVFRSKPGKTKGEVKGLFFLLPQDEEKQIDIYIRFTDDLVFVGQIFELV